ncbi:MAG: sugar ABC transporter substrate-binding protein [Clostridiales bacterium]|nr:sugar ABC transporter substrate-binding protein [Clostridiales bacterium]
MLTKRTKIIAVLAAMVLLVSMLAACTSQPSAPAEDTPAPAPAPAAPAPAGNTHDGPGTYNYHLGLIQPGPEFYYQSFADSVRMAAEYAGMTVTALLAEYSSEKEISNVEDLIAQGVDAIAVFSVSSETAQINAQLCEEAGIPLFLMSSVAAEGPAKATSTIGNSFYDMGYEIGQWVANNVPGELRVLEIQGQLGQGVAEPHSQGFEAATIGRGDIEVIFRQTANWVRAEAISITEDTLMSDLDYNMVLVHNEDMCAGVVNVLEENGVLGQIQVVTFNGSDPGIEMIGNGQVLATCANPPSYVGGDVVVQILKWFDGEAVPETYDSPIFIIDSTNVNDPNLVTWDKVWATSRVDEYFASR